MDKLKETMERISDLNFALGETAQRRLDNLTKPLGSLGRLEKIARRVVEITGNEAPSIKDKVIFTMAADHGVSEEGVSAYPKEVTAQMVYNFLAGGAGINVLARHTGARVVVVDMGVAEKIQKFPPTLKIASADLPKPRTAKAEKNKNQKFRDKKIAYGTKNIAKGPAMTIDEAIRSVEAGVDVFEEEFARGVDIVGTGDMGIGNTTPSSAITSVITARSVEEVTGRGTGIDDGALSGKIEAIKKAISINRPHADDGIDVLSKIGGFEIGALAGVILAAASRKVPIVIDGFISGAAALVAARLEPKAIGYMIASHSSVEKGHRVILDYLNLEPLFDFNLRLGEGTGAALGIGIVEASVKVMREMATFQEAGVSEGT